MVVFVFQKYNEKEVTLLAANVSLQKPGVFCFCALESQLPYCQEALGLLNDEREHRKAWEAEVLSCAFQYQPCSQLSAAPK